MRLSKFINKTFLKKVGKEADIIDSNYTIQNINIKDGHNIKRDELKKETLFMQLFLLLLKKMERRND